MEVGGTSGKRASEFGCSIEDRTQLDFDLAAIQDLGRATRFKAFFGSTGPLRDARNTDRKRLLRVCPSISSSIPSRGPTLD